MNKKPDPFGRDASRPLLIPPRAGCAFYALLAIFPALSALISLYGLAADPANVAQNFGMLAYVLPPQAYDMVIDQIRRVAEASDRTLGRVLSAVLGESANGGAGVRE